MKWRPKEGWYPKAIRRKAIAGSDNPTDLVMIEAGADAMLEVLKEKGSHGYCYDPLLDCELRSWVGDNHEELQDVAPDCDSFSYEDKVVGWLVFIPKENDG